MRKQQPFVLAVALGAALFPMRRCANIGFLFVGLKNLASRRNRRGKIFRMPMTD